MSAPPQGFVQANPTGAIVFTSSTTWVVPAGLSKPVNIIGLGGGGGGGGGYSSTYTGGGGGSGSIQYVRALLSPGMSVNINIGAGGSGGAGGSSPTAGGAGGGTSVIISGHQTALLFAQGGYGGGPATSSANGANGSGGAAANGTIDYVCISGFGINGSAGQGTTWALAPVLPLGSVASTSNIETLSYWWQGSTSEFGPYFSGFGGPGGGVDSGGWTGGNGLVLIWWGD